MNITPVKFSQVGLYQNKTCNSSVSQNNSNFNSYSLQKNADTVSFSGLLRKPPMEKVLSELGVSKKIQKGFSAFFENSINFMKKFKKAIDTEDVPENLAKPAKKVADDGLELFGQIVSKGEVDPTLENRFLNNILSAMQDMRAELSSPKYDENPHLKNTILEAFDFFEEIIITPPQSKQEGIETLKRITKLIKDLTKDESIRKEFSEFMKK